MDAENRHVKAYPAPTNSTAQTIDGLCPQVVQIGLFEDCYNQKQCCVSKVRTGKHMTKHQLVLTFLFAGEVPFVLHKRETVLPPIILVSHFTKNVW